MGAEDTVVAAGGVVYRPHGHQVEVALVHRPRYDDWTLPKGKLEDGEGELEAAVREVREELGAHVTLSRRLGRVRYRTNGADKTVAYWAMRYRSGDFTANDEVDEITWLSPGMARKRLSYDLDAQILAEFTGLPAPEATVVLVRHAKAGKRSQWNGDDAERPLEHAGRRQARRLAAVLVHFGPDAVLSADRTRCIQTVEPLAAALGVTVQLDRRFDDESFGSAPDETYDALLALGKPGQVTVVCSQGDTIPALIDRVSPTDVVSDTRKAASWVLTFVDGDVVSADHYDAP